jgi:chromosome partitioning protein
MSHNLQIVTTGDKGGVGKTTIAILMAEWMLAQGRTVTLIDADPNRSLQTWIDKCSDLNFEVSKPNGDVLIVDTAGTSGAGASHLRNANIIVAPFKPHTGDLEVVLSWFLNLREALQERVVFVPNERANTKEQRACMGEIEATLAEEKRGRLVGGLNYRPAAYGALLDGRAGNIFKIPFDGFDHKAKNEVEALMASLAGDALSLRKA